MRKLNVLLLGWDFPPISNGGSSETCYGISKALANRVNLSLILPKSDPEFILSNVDLTGLNNVNLQELKPAAKEPGFSAFSEAQYIRSDIELYGAPTPTGPAQYESQVVAQPGQAVSAGTLGENRDVKSIAENVEELNIFGEKDLSLVDRNSQVIHYARYASRLASQRQYDVIYAYDWRTFLAGIELKLVSGKPLVLHMHSVSYEYGGPDSKGWIYEIEKQALEKADSVIANTAALATIIEEEYAIKADKITFLNEEEVNTEATAPSIDAEVATAEEISDEIYNMEVSESNNELVKAVLPVKEVSEKKEAVEKKEEKGIADMKEVKVEASRKWETAADSIWEVLRLTTEPEATV